MRRLLLGMCAALLIPMGATTAIAGARPAPAPSSPPVASVATTTSTTSTSTTTTSTSTTSTTSTTVAPTTTVAAPVPAARPAPAPIAPQRTTTPTATPAQRGAAALALISFPWPRLGYTIVFTGPTPGIEGSTDRLAKTITIYVRPSATTHHLAFVLGHEIGHAVDFTTLSWDSRDVWIAARGLSRPWFGCSGCMDLQTPAGDWAESFAAWQVGAAGEFASELGPPPDAAQLALLAQLAG